MGLSHAVYKGVIQKGYKVPTPIQRKCIPIIMEGKDVVAMARTGSGKTAAFLIPMFERLQARKASTGARCLIMSPTRELALQTLKFTKDLGKHTGLKSAVVLGGDRMDDQFAAIHENPDIIIATPGRFLHVVMEMDLKLSEIEYIVFDEADRLFEMGFQEQLREIINRLPDMRQTLLFSATLPKVLVDFAKAGLSDPILVRLDVDNKLNDNLKMAYVGCRSEDKIAVLLHLLKCIVKPNELTIIFLATKHHIEYLAMILEKAGISATYIYSSLDQHARRANVIKFQKKQASVLLVTDIAARGIDIPLLDNAINFHFPSKSKLFVHRVGRVARAGRSGTAYSLVTPEEMPYVLDLHLFLGQPMKYASTETDSTDWNGVYGTSPQNIIDENEESLQLWHNGSVDLVNMKRVSTNAYKQYLKSRPLPSVESVRRMKEDLQINNVQYHPLFGKIDCDLESERTKILEGMKFYRPQATIFEVNSTSKNVATTVMKQVRMKNTLAVRKHHDKLKERIEQKEYSEALVKSSTPSCLAQKEDIEDAFSTVMESKKRRAESHKTFGFDKKKKEKITDFKDKEYYLEYKPRDHHSEQGLGLDKPSFEQQANGAILDLTGDDVKDLRKHKNQMRWDRKKKKFVHEGGNQKVTKRIKTESGVWIPASYKTDVYKQWQKKSKVEQVVDSDAGSDEDTPARQNRNIPRRWRNNQTPKQTGQGPNRRELKTNEEIMKGRRLQAKKRYQERKLQATKSKKAAKKRGRRF